MTRTIAAVIAAFVGGGIGSVLRLLAGWLVRGCLKPVFPFATLAVNAIGCFLIGIAYGLFDRSHVSETAKTFVITGLLGGFTTFSAFGLETVNLVRESRFLAAFGNVALNVGFGFAFAAAGLAITGGWVRK